MRYQFIQQHQGQFRMTVLLRVLGVSASAFYQWQKCPASVQARQKEQLAAQVCELFEQSEGCYGSSVPLERQSSHSPRFAGYGYQVQPETCRPTDEGAKPLHKPRKFVVTTDSGHAFPVAQNLLNREYLVEAVDGLNRARAGDITYIRTAQGWLYMAVVLDLKSRKVIDWSMKDTLEQTLVHETLEMALGRRLSVEASEALLFHSDRGSQYAAHAYQERLEEWNITCSMSRKGNCWDNAVVECFFATLKKENVHREYYMTHERPKPACFTTSKSSTIESEGIQNWATSAHTITNNPYLTNCPLYGVNSTYL